MSRHPLGGALRISEEPSRAAFLAGVERLWSGPFASQNENVDSNVFSESMRQRHTKRTSGERFFPLRRLSSGGSGERWTAVS